jgi:hypothetical protein
MNILETRIFYLKGKRCRIVVLVDCTSVGKPYSDIRVIEAINKPCSGYEFIKPNKTLSDDLINRIADFGMEINPDDVLKEEAKKANRSLSNYVECILMDSVYTEPNEETITAIEEAKRGEYAGIVDTSSVEAMIKSME